MSNEATIHRMCKLLEEFIKKIKIVAYLSLNHGNESLYNTSVTVKCDNDAAKYVIQDIKFIMESEDWGNLENTKLARILQKVENLSYHYSPLMNKFINDIRTLKNLSVLEMRTTPKMKLSRETSTCNFRKNLHKGATEVKHLRITLEEQRTMFQNFLKKILIELAINRAVVQTVKETSEKKMIEQGQKSTEAILIARKQKQAKEIVFQTEKDCYEKRQRQIKNEHLLHKEASSSIHSATKKQYINLLWKYDNDIGAHYQLLEKLTNEKDFLKTKQNDLLRLLSIQSELYERLKKERQLAITRKFIVRLEHFKRNRATKIIQRAWRLYRERVAFKKKKRLKKR